MQIAAIFDMDDTLLSDSSGKLLLQYLRQKGQLLQFFNRRSIVSLFTAPILYKLGLINVERFMQRSVQLAAGYDVDDLWTLVNGWFDEMLVNYVSEGGRTQLAWHRDQGHVPSSAARAASLACCRLPIIWASRQFGRSGSRQMGR